MCKIGGRPFWKWAFKSAYDYNKTRSNEETAKLEAEKRASEERAEELRKPISEEVQGEMPTPVVPVKTQGTGINTLPRIGLNL